MIVLGQLLPMLPGLFTLGLPTREMNRLLVLGGRTVTRRIEQRGNVRALELAAHTQGHTFAPHPDLRVELSRLETLEQQTFDSPHT